MHLTNPGIKHGYRIPSLKLYEESVCLGEIPAQIHVIWTIITQVIPSYRNSAI